MFWKPTECPTAAKVLVRIDMLVPIISKVWFLTAFLGSVGLGRAGQLEVSFPIIFCFFFFFFFGITFPYVKCNTHHQVQLQFLTLWSIKEANPTLHHSSHECACHRQGCQLVVFSLPPGFGSLFNSHSSTVDMVFSAVNLLLLRIHQEREISVTSWLSSTKSSSKVSHDSAAFQSREVSGNAYIWVILWGSASFPVVWNVLSHRSTEGCNKVSSSLNCFLSSSTDSRWSWKNPAVAADASSTESIIFFRSPTSSFWTFRQSFSIPPVLQQSCWTVRPALTCSSCNLSHVQHL